MRDPNIYTTEAFKKLLRKWNLTTMRIKNELTHDWWTLIHDKWMRDNESRDRRDDVECFTGRSFRAIGPRDN